MSYGPLARALKRLNKPNLRAEVFEYDNRFAAFGSDFHFFDYKAPLEVKLVALKLCVNLVFSSTKVDRSLREQFDLVFADPPFLSDECLTKTAVTIRCFDISRGSKLTHGSKVPGQGAPPAGSLHRGGDGRAGQEAAGSQHLLIPARPLQ